MLKKLSTIFLSMLCFASLCIGIMVSACPVIPYVKYYHTKSLAYYEFNLFGSVTKGDGSTNHHNFLNVGLYTTLSDDDTIYLEDSYYSSTARPYTVTNNKKTLTNLNPDAPSVSSYENIYKASFNPTFIFYIVSAGALTGIIAINIPKKKKDE